MQDTFTTAKS